jgi:hypothetical protein
MIFTVVQEPQTNAEKGIAFNRKDCDHSPCSSEAIRSSHCSTKGQKGTDAKNSKN